MKRLSAAILALLAATLLATASVLAQESNAKPAKAAPGLAVTDAKLGTDVQNKTIVGEATAFSLNQKVYLWLELTGGPADDITVTWKNGDKSYETKLKVGGPTYHTWAYKTAAIAGSWTVSVSDASGNVLKELNFKASGKAGM
jgi:hypothetical protein